MKQNGKINIHGPNSCQKMEDSTKLLLVSPLDKKTFLGGDFYFRIFVANFTWLYNYSNFHLVVKEFKNVQYVMN